MGKDPDAATPDTVLDYPPAFRCVEDALNGAANFAGKPAAQGATALFVEPHLVRKLQRGLRMKLVPHFASSCSMRR